MTAPESLRGDPELDATAELAQKQVAELAARTARSLGQLGFEHVVVRICKVVRGKNGECALPGATACHSQAVVLPCLPLEAQELRRLAEQFEEAFRKGGTEEAESGYSVDADPAEWP